MEVHEGSDAEATVTLKMKAEHYIKLVNGDLDGRLAFMTGKLRVTGNIPLAMKMEQLFPRG